MVRSGLPGEDPGDLTPQGCALPHGSLWMRSRTDGNPLSTQIGEAMLPSLHPNHPMNTCLMVSQGLAWKNGPRVACGVTSGNPQAGCWGTSISRSLPMHAQPLW